MVAKDVLDKLFVQSLRFQFLRTQTEVILLKVTFNSSAEQRIQPTAMGRSTQGNFRSSEGVISY